MHAERVARLFAFWCAGSTADRAGSDA